MVSEVRVPTFASAAPRGVREEVCARLARAVNTDTAFWYGLAADGAVRNAVVVGSSRVKRRLDQFTGARAPAGAVGSESDEVLRARRGAWRLEAPPRHLRTQFRGMLDDFVSVDAFRELPIWRSFYRACGLDDQLRMLPYQGDVSLGWIGAVRDDGRRFTPAERGAAGGLVAEVTQGLAAARALESFSGDIAHAVVLPDGRLEAACLRATPWLTHERIALLAEAARRADRDTLPVCRIDAAVVRFTRLDGAGGVRYLALLSRERVPQLSSSLGLSPAEHGVATGAAAGLTVRELAVDLGVSVNTVKYHLKNAYLKLGVSTRLELARALGRHSGA